MCFQEWFNSDRAGHIDLAWSHNKSAFFDASLFWSIADMCIVAYDELQFYICDDKTSLIAGARQNLWTFLFIQNDFKSVEAESLTHKLK